MGRASELKASLNGLKIPKPEEEALLLALEPKAAQRMLLAALESGVSGQDEVYNAMNEEQSQSDRMGEERAWASRLLQAFHRSKGAEAGLDWQHGEELSFSALYQPDTWLLSLIHI